jgi:hypothetical protein
MANLVPQTTDEATEVARATAPTFIKGFADLTMRKRIWMALLRKYGRVLFNQGGHTTVWGVRVREATPHTIGANPTFDFNSINRNEQLSLDWRGYGHEGVLWVKDKLMNGQAGASQLWNMLNDRTETLAEEFARMFNREIYVDGEAAGNGERFHGRGTFLNYKAGVTSDDRVALPDGSYAGLSIELGGLGGSCTNAISAGEKPNTDLGADWPEGQATADFDATSPLILNISSDRWTPDGGTTWRDNNEAILSYTNEIQSARGARESRTAGEAPILNLMTAKMKNEFEMGQRGRFQINLQMQEMIDLGFPDTYRYEGAVIAADYECPHGEMHQLSPGTMEYAALTEDYWTFEGPTYLPGQMKWIWLLYTYGNFRFQPKCEAFGKSIA